MVWHDCLLTTNDEHLFTGEAWVCAVGKEAKAGSFPAGSVGGSGMLPSRQLEKAADCRKATD